MEDLKQQYLDELKRLSNLEYRDEVKIAELTENFNVMSIVIRKKEKLLQQEQWAYLSTHPSKRLHSFCFDDDDDEDYTSVIIPDEPVLSTEEPDNSLCMGDEHLDTIPATKSDEFIKSGVENLILIPSESEGESDFFLEVDAFLAVEDEFTSSQFPKLYLDPEGDMLLLEAYIYDDHSFDFKTKSSSTSLNSLLEETNNFDNSLPEFITFSKVLFDAEYESDSCDDQSSSDEDVLEKIISKPLSEEEIIPMKSLRTHDSSLPVLSKIDSILYEFAGELTLLKSIPPRIDETDCDFKEDILNLSLHLLSSLRIVTLLWRKLIYSVLRTTQCCRALWTRIMNLKGIFSFIRTCLEIIPFHLLKKSLHFDIPLFSRPPAKPPDGDTGILNIKMMGDVSDQKAFMHKLMITLASHQEKSPDLLSHRCRTVKTFNTYRSHLNECPMLIHGQNNPPLDALLVPLILGRPFLRTARALIDIHGEEMILRDGDERLTLNMKHDTASYSNHPYRESVNLINIFNLSSEDCLKDLVPNKQSGNLTFLLHKEIALPEVIPEFNVYPDDFLEIESDANFDDDSFDSDGEKTKEAELLIDQLDLPCDILYEYDSFNSHDFSRDDVLFSPNNEDKDFDHPFYELLVFKEVPNSMRLLPFSFENEKKVFKPGIYTSKKFHCCFLSELSHP
nr:reverse transcriptase domain-containing protein [Tanacetum cinerariifolium]